MDELIKFLTSKIGYTLTAILGFGLPGNLFIFVWNRSLYVELDIVKLLVLSFAISFGLFIPNLLIFLSVISAKNQISKKKYGIYNIAFSAILATIIEITVMIVIKILNPEYTIKVLLEMISPEYIVAYLIILLAGIIVEGIAKKIKHKNN